MMPQKSKNAKSLEQWASLLAKKRKIDSQICTKENMTLQPPPITPDITNEDSRGNDEIVLTNTTVKQHISTL